MTQRLILETFLPYRLSYTSNLVSEAVARTYKSLFGLTISEWRVIAHIAENAGITQQEIVLRSRMDKVTVSRAAVALAKRELIDRRPYREDKRTQALVLTASGDQLFAEIAPKALELQHSLFGRFEPAEIELLAAMLRRIDKAALRLSGPDVRERPTDK